MSWPQSWLSSNGYMNCAPAMLRILISPKTTPSASVANTVEPSSDTTVSLPRLMMYSSLPMSPLRHT